MREELRAACLDVLQVCRHLSCEQGPEDLEVLARGVAAGAFSSLAMATSISLMSVAWTALRSPPWPAAAAASGAPCAPCTGPAGPMSSSAAMSAPPRRGVAAVGLSIGSLPGGVQPRGGSGFGSHDGW